MADYVTDPNLLSQLDSAPVEHTPTSFALQYAPAAQAAGARLGVDPSLLLGQWGLETGWGKSVVPGTNNLGNIKDMSGGGTAARDNQTGSNDRYRQYASADDFAADHADLLSRRYPGTVGAGSDVSQFAHGLSGYAEDPAYANKLASTVAAVRKAVPGLLARVGDAAASAISGTANAATAQYVTDPNLLSQLNGVQQAQPASQQSAAPSLDLVSDAEVQREVAQDQQRGAAPLTADQPAPQPGVLDSLVRQGGLTARAIGHGIADAAGLVANPVNATINAAGRAIGHDPELQDVDTLIKRGVDSVTPAPANNVERVVGDMGAAVANPTNLLAGPIMAGAGGVLSAAGRGALAGAATSAMQPLHQGDTLGTMAARGAGGAVGGLLGGAGGAAVSGAVDRLVNGTNALMTAIRSASPEVQRTMNVNADSLLIQVAEREGIDLSAIPKSILNGMRGQVAEAMASNKTLDAAALLRRAEGEAILGPQNGLTLGQATRNPMQFAAEKNLRGINGAGEPLTERFANQNTGLISALNQRGAANAAGEFNTGQGTINALAAHDAAARQNIGGLYDQARALDANDLPLDHRVFADTALENLDRAMKTGFLPPSIKDIVNGVSSGRIPLNISTSEQIKSTLAEATRTAQRANDGNTVHALNIVRNALEDAQPVGSAPFGGNQVIPHGAQLPPRAADAEAVAAFNRARSAARARFGEIETNPALRAVVRGDAVPDTFFKRYVLNGNVKDVNALLGLVPDQGNALKTQIVNYLKSKALSGASDEVGVFSQSGYNRALNSIGDAKLHALFTPAEVAELKQIGRVAANIQAQPAGSAVNNSNTGAAVMNALSQMSGKVGGLPGINIARNSLNQFLNERSVSQALGARVQPQANPGLSGSLNPLLPFAAAAGGSVTQPRH